MTNVIPFNAYTRNDIDPDQVLEGAKGQLKQVLILGVCEDGDLYAAASTADKGKLLYAAKVFEMKLLTGDFDDE